VWPLIRDFRIGDEPVLAAVMFSSIHELARQDYSPAQLEAWAPRQYDEDQWAVRIRAIHPFVAEVDGGVVGYADLQVTGYIDHFFVAGPCSRRGVGTALMQHIHLAAQKRHIVELWSNVSVTAESFFAKHGFIVEARQSVSLRGVTMPNSRMRKQLVANSPSRRRADARG
jgi:putative acetyltransferase